MRDIGVWSSNSKGHIPYYGDIDKSKGSVAEKKCNTYLIEAIWFLSFVKMKEHSIYWQEVKNLGFYRPICFILHKSFAIVITSTFQSTTIQVTKTTTDIIDWSVHTAAEIPAYQTDGVGVINQAPPNCGRDLWLVAGVFKPSLYQKNSA